MATKVQPERTARAVPNEGVWIEGRLGAPPPDASGPMVFGADWLLEMLRNEETGAAFGFFWAPFAIIWDFPDLKGMSGAEFVGFSQPGKPRVKWLTTSMVFDLGTAPLARTPGELVALLDDPRPYKPLEVTPRSAVSKRGRDLIAATYRTETSIRDIAHDIGVSHAHLTREFKRDFGITPVNYRHRLRVSEAIGRLQRGEGILEVGYDVGFNETSRFYEDFRKVTGTSPGKCR